MDHQVGAIPPLSYLFQCVGVLVALRADAPSAPGPGPGMTPARLNERHRTNRRYFQFTMTADDIRDTPGWGSWAVMRFLVYRARAVQSDPAKLVYLHHRVTPIGVTTTFEVLP